MARRPQVTMLRNFPTAAKRRVTNLGSASSDEPPSASAREAGTSCPTASGTGRRWWTARKPVPLLAF